MDMICRKIMNASILDTEVIQETESLKQDSGFDINSAWEYNNCSILINAVLQSRKELVEYLLKDPDININRADPNNNCTALYWACVYANVSILKLLLDHRNIDVNIQTSGGWTGLHNVSSNNKIKIVRELLLDARINTSLRDKWRNIAEDHARWRGYYGIANMLKRTGCTFLLRIPNASLCRDIVRMIICEYV